MNQKALILLLLILLLVSCTRVPSAALPTATQPQVSTALPPLTPARTATPRPSATITPTSTPTPTATSKVFVYEGHTLLAYESPGPMDKRLVLLNLSDGTSQEFSFPEGAIFATPFLAGLSPDARYFVYYEGARVEPYDQLIAEPPDFVMHVLDLDTQEVIFSTPLLSPGYPQNLKPLVEQTMDEYWMQETDHQAMLDDLYHTMQNSMMSNMRNVAWSPDGSLLAFPSENPGPTSDMYFYDPLKGEAWRVTSEPRSVFAITWAPDSASIALETTLYLTQATAITTDLLARSGTRLGTVEYTYFHGWLGPDKFLLNRAVDFGDQYLNLVMQSLPDNTQTTLWKGSLEYFAFSPDLSSYLITSSQPNEPGQAPGLYLLKSPTATPLHLSESLFWKVAYWGSDQFTYAASASNSGMFDVPQEGGTFGITPDGQLYPIDEGNWYLLPSPDGKFLAAYGPFEKMTGLRVFGGDGKLLATLSDARITCLAWEATTDSLAYQVGQNLYLWQEGSTAYLTKTKLEDQLDWWKCAFGWVNPAH